MLSRLMRQPRNPCWKGSFFMAIDLHSLTKKLIENTARTPGRFTRCWVLAWTARDWIQPGALSTRDTMRWLAMWMKRLPDAWQSTRCFHLGLLHRHSDPLPQAS